MKKVISLFPIKTYDGLSGPYLSVITLYEWLYKNVGYKICLHKIHRSDEDPECHDHPFDFLTLILWGGYREYLEDGSYILRKPLSLVYRKAEYRHRVELVKSISWSLCIKRDIDREWGFYRKGEFIPWQEFINLKGLKLSK